jgi:hypothetical protein
MSPDPGADIGDVAHFAGEYTALALKNDSAPFETTVLPTVRLSISLVIPVLDELLVGPTPPVMASPNLSIHEPTRNRSPGDDDRPKVPNAYPGRPRPRTLILFKILAACDHLQSRGDKGAKWSMIAWIADPNRACSVRRCYRVSMTAQRKPHVKLDVDAGG